MPTANLKVIRRKDLGPTGVPQTLFDINDGLNRPHGLALDSGAGLLYWTDTDAHALMRGSIDGVGAPQMLAGGLDGQVGPWGIAVAVPEPGIATIVGLLAILAARQSMCRMAARRAP